MRKFSEFEKEAIKKMVQKKQTEANVLDLLADIALNEHRALSINHDTKNMTAIKKPSDTMFFNELVESVFLIKYLEKESLIFFHSNYEPPQLGDYLSVKSSLINNSSSKSYEKNEFSTTIYDDILDFQKTYFVCSTELIEHVKNGFRSMEQIRHNENIKESKKNLKIAEQSLNQSYIGLDLSRKSIKKATSAIIISIVLGGVSIFSSFYIAFQQSKNSIKIDQNQVDEFNNKIEYIKTRVDSVTFQTDTKSHSDTAKYNTPPNSDGESIK
jgi:hypothetical protein